MSSKRSSPRASGSDRVVIRVKERAEPDLRRLARALIDLALAEQEAENEPTKPAPSDKSGGDL